MLLCNLPSESNSLTSIALGTKLIFTPKPYVCIGNVSAVQVVKNSSECIVKRYLNRRQQPSILQNSKNSRKKQQLQ